MENNCQDSRNKDSILWTVNSRIECVRSAPDQRGNPIAGKSRGIFTTIQPVLQKIWHVFLLRQELKKSEYLSIPSVTFLLEHSILHLSLSGLSQAS